jgi:hypothetical protein
VDHPEEKTPQEQPASGTRLIVLWLCWVVMAVFLTTAGVIAF